MNPNKRTIFVTLAISVLVMASTQLGGPSRAMAAGVSISVVSPSPGGHSLVLDAIGNPAIAFVEATAGHLAFAHCNDPECSGGNESVSIAYAQSVGNLSIQLDASGNPVIAAIDLTTDDLKIIHCNDPDCADNDESVATPDGDGFGGLVLREPSLRVDAIGSPVVSYQDNSSGTLKILYCLNTNCTGSNIITTHDTAGFTGFHSSLALDEDGNPVVSYLDAGNQDLKILRCDDFICDGIGDVITVADTGMVYGYTSLSLDRSGNPAVSYLTGGGLALLRCNDKYCSGGGESITTPDSAGTGYGTALAIDALGRPIVVYQRGFPVFDLFLMHCNDHACAGAGDLQVAIDTTGSIGYYPAMALDAQGLTVAYYDQTNGALKVARCGDQSCKTAGSDTDLDGCLDADEQQTSIGSETSGGRRDANNVWDYFNPSLDGQNRVDDILLVVQAYFKDDNDGTPGMPPYEPGYNPATDRSNAPGSPNPWNVGAPDGLQRVQDILHAVKQYFHDCA